MLYELSQSNFDRVRPLFEAHRDHTVCMCGFNDPATRIVVDDIEHPRSALMVTWDVWGYLAGDPSNTPFNQALNEAITRRTFLKDGIWGLLLTVQPEGWLAQLPDIVAPSTLVPFPRRIYTIERLSFDWRSAVPAGYEIQPIDRTLQDKFPGIEIPDDVQKLLEVEHPIQQGFGYAAVCNGEVTAHAMIDFIYQKEGDIGLYTQEAHRRKGLATATSAACIEYGLAHGLHLVRWDCHAENAGSIRTAEKLGLVYQFDYPMHYFDF